MSIAWGNVPGIIPTQSMRAVGAAVAVGVIAAEWPAIEYWPFSVLLASPKKCLMFKLSSKLIAIFATANRLIRIEPPAMTGLSVVSAEAPCGCDAMAGR